MDDMCSPAAIPFITSGINAGVGMIQNATEASATAKAAERTAKLQKEQGDQAYADTMSDSRRRLASQRVGYAKGGVTAEGSPSDVLASMARDGDVAARTARDRGYEEARNTLLDASQRNRAGLFGSLRGVNQAGGDLLQWALTPDNKGKK
jgi:hypothetical protein